MERGLILLAAALMVFVAPGVQGTAHLSFATNRTVNITRDGCGSTKLCVETPDDCDPAGNGTCLFGAVNTSTPMAPNGTDLSIQLRGNSQGYVALGLTANASVGTTMLFICAQNSSNNGTFFFRTMQRNNTDNELSPTETIVREIRGSVEGDVIRCEFDVPGVNATSTRTSHAITFSILLGSGTVNGGVIGAFNSTLNSGPLNITNPASNNVNTTPAPATTSGASSVLHPHALLLLLSVLTLSVKLRA
ncbi:putative ferric-chelate reductase 1 [Seriola dumerili]|uniref:putative ferric-chelate reductase 1 n=1 Tax=Seriola dumerili TaxID=41447 RepID=UPI000BBF0F2F|nr:putative ferric-chelate reductase 1 [Seriola dumerili]